MLEPVDHREHSPRRRKLQREDPEREPRRFRNPCQSEVRDDQSL